MSKSESTASQAIETRQLYTGFFGALVLSFIAYFAVTQQWFSEDWIAASFVLFLAFLQFVIQSLYFLHLKGEKGKRLRSNTFIYTIAMTLIVVCGSIWVVYNLNYRMGMTGEQMEQHLLKENTKGF